MLPDVYVLLEDKPRIRKSHLNMFKKCPHYYYLHCLKRIEEPQTFEAQLGQLFHSWAKRFMMKLNPPLTRKDMQKMVPHDVLPELRDWMLWFIDVEWRRYSLLTQEGYEDYWKPVALEWHVEVEMEDYIAVGTIDRVDEDPAGGLIIIEYKTSRKPHLSRWRRELAFYSRIVEKLGYKVKYVAVILPSLRQVVCETLKPVTFVFLEKLINRFLNAQRENLFPPKPGDQCIFCPARSLCKYATEVHGDDTSS